MTEPSKIHDESSDCYEGEIKNPFSGFSFYNYMYEELVPDTDFEQASRKYDSRRSHVYALLKIPWGVESFLTYGLLQSLDQFLQVYTFLPLRCFFAIISLIFRFPKKIIQKKKLPAIDPGQLPELMKILLILFCTYCLSYADTSVVYHLIRSQSVIKLYIFFNMLEVADRLLSAVSQDALDALSWVTLNNRDSRVNYAHLVCHFLGAMACLLLHCGVMLFQVTTLNVAFNSHNKALLTIMMSNNFVELKGSVFKKFAKNNLFQMSCSDARERFHYIVMLGIVMFRNMSATGWVIGDLQDVLIDALFVLLAEVLVDWIKHAFITKFNTISPDVYKEYTVSIAYDLLLCRQNHTRWDYFDLLSRRMGLTPLPLSCLVNVIVMQTLPANLPTEVFYVIPFLIIGMFATKVLLHLLLLFWAYVVVHAYEMNGLQDFSHLNTSTTTQDELILPSLKKHRRTCSEGNLAATLENANLVLPNNALPSELTEKTTPFEDENNTGNANSLVDSLTNSLNSSFVDEIGALNPLISTYASSPRRIERSQSLVIMSPQLTAHVQSHFEEAPSISGDMEIRNRTKSKSETSDGLPPEPVKQPLPDVDRFSMYSSQIV